MSTMKTFQLFVCSCFILITNINLLWANENFQPWVDVNQNGCVDKIEAQRYTVFLKNENVLALGIEIDQPTTYDPNTFYTIQSDGYETFTLLNNRIRLIAIKPPNQFSKEPKSDLSSANILSHFLLYNWPEINHWQLEEKEDTNNHIIFANGEYLHNEIPYQLKIEIHILKEINKIVQLRSFFVKNQTV
ncbi:MAG: hypothetical protein PHW50_02305 [Patescibacteria group bacterium]|nr:hypothetical protein [Patescibacteria group bacterium]